MKTSLRMLFVALIAVAGVYATSPSIAHAQGHASEIGTDRKIGVGLGGGPILSGLTAKYWLAEDSAIQATLGLALSYGGSFGVSVDYQIMEIRLTEFGFGILDLHLGAGGSFTLHSDINNSWFEIGPHAAIGPGLKFNFLPLEFAVEWQPGFQIAIGDPDPLGGGLNIIGTAGYLRYYF